jgi:hypothetical protein
MKLRIILTSAIPLLLLMSACGQVGSNQTNTEKLIGKWKAADSTSFRGKEIEFLPDHEVKLTLADGGVQDGQYEIQRNAITFSIGDAPPFNMNFRFDDDSLYLAFPDTKVETKYIKLND